MIAGGLVKQWRREWESPLIAGANSWIGTECYRNPRQNPHKTPDNAKPPHAKTPDRDIGLGLFQAEVNSLKGEFTSR